MSNILLSKTFAGQEVRVAGTPDEPWFVANDVCAVLGLSNVSQAVSRLEAWMKDDITTNDVTGREQSMLGVNEPGLYALVFTSRKPEAKAFQHWVYSEVLPSIRKTGRYAVDGGDFWNQPIDVALKQAATIDRMMKSAGGWEKGAAAVFQSRLLGLMGITDQDIAEMVGSETAQSMAIFRSCLDQLGVSLDEAGNVQIDPMHVQAGLRPPVIHRTRSGEFHLAVESPALTRVCGDDVGSIMTLVSNHRGTARFPDGKGSTSPARCRWFDLDTVRTALS